MQFTIPDYYKDFSCIAGACPDTCCAGWQIMIDPVTLRKYRRRRGPFRQQLHRGINFRSGCFHQNEHRCAFLNDTNLCEIYRHAGKQMLCDTCRRYPRHIEEYEGLCEISLSLSCPEAARLILNQTDTVSWAHYERNRREAAYEDFDLFLFTILMDSRDYILEVLQNRNIPLNTRMAKVLAYSHDLQLCLDRNELFRVEELRRCHKRSGYTDSFQRKWDHLTNGGPGAYKLMPDIWITMLPHMEVLKPAWIGFVKNSITSLYARPEHEYEELHTDLRQSYPDLEIEAEQLLVYWVFTYFCGAVYDGDAFSKIKLALVSTLLILELDAATFLNSDNTFTKADQIRICYQYSRELEHSDENLRQLEKLLSHESVFSFSNLLRLLCS